MRRALAFAFALVLAASAAPAQSAGLRVRVVDEDSGAPIIRAEVRLESGRAALTDSAGMLYLAGIPAGEWGLKSTRLGYRPQRIRVRVANGRDLEVEVALRPLPVALPTLRARAKRVEARLRTARFYERRRSASGTSWDRGQLDAMGPPGDLRALIPRIPGFSLQQTGGDTSWIILNNRGPGLPQVCPVRVLVDGQPAGSGRLSGLEVAHLAGMEAYAGPATAPADLAVLADGARCGLLAIWTLVGP